MRLYKSSFTSDSGRLFYNPTDECRQFGKKLIGELYKRWTVPEYIYNTKHKSHLGALRAHMVKSPTQKTRWFSYFDISNFFGSVTRNKIVRALKPYFGHDAALEIASNSVVRNKAVVDGGSKYVLPFGFVQSPMLASLVLDKSRLGHCLRRLSRNKGITISVYVDDIIISSTDKCLLEEATKEVLLAIQESNFTINSDKSQETRQAITVFNIDLDSFSMQLTEERFELFKEKIDQNRSNKSVVSGMFNYLSLVSIEQLEKLST